MATKKPRITVTLEQDHYDILSEFARQQGCSMSSALAEIWAEAVPTIQRVVKLIAEAEQAKASVGDRIRDIATEAQEAMIPHAREAVAQFDIFEKQVAEAIAKARAGASSSGAPATEHDPHARGGKRRSGK